MKTFRQLILELTAYQKLERDSWKKASSRKTDVPTPKRTVKTAMPWFSRSDSVGWYHPTQKSFIFKWSTTNYHITQIMKSPQLFGLTRADIMGVLVKKCKLDKEPQIQKMAEAYERSLLSGDMDSMHEITDLVLNKGWVMVNISYNHIELRANLTQSHKAAVREILESGDFEKMGKHIKIINEISHNKDLTLIFLESVEKFLHS